MFFGISNTTCTITIKIDVFLIDVNDGPAINVGIFLIDNSNKSNNCVREWEDFTLGVRY